MAVLFYHSGSTYARESAAMPKIIVNFLGHGWLGVPFFFILSGFILANVYGGKELNPSGSRAFFVARFARIYPVYFLALLGVAPFVTDFDMSRDWQQFFMLQSWSPVAWARNWNGPAWTLSVELFFYLLFPFLLPPLERSRAKILWLLLALVFMMLTAIWLNMGIPGIAGYNPAPLFQHLPLVLIRLPEFLYGMVLGTLFLRRAEAVSSVGFYVAILIVLLAIAQTRSFFSHAIAICALGPLVYCTAGIRESSLAARILGNQVLVFLGGASYSIYLLQVPVLQMLDVIIPHDLIALRRLIYVPLVVAIASVVFAWFEQPGRKILRQKLGRGLT
jgi:peptidoglycan/LPS O-acetylase OafA/YrhL